MAGYWLAGLWNAPVTHYYLLSLPFTIPAILIGRVLHHRLLVDHFLRYVHSGLVLTGLALLVQAVRF